MAGIEDPAVRTIATTILSTVARQIQNLLVRAPSDIELEAKSCGENAQHLAYWNGHRKAIGLCSELIRDRLQAEARYRARQVGPYPYGPYSETSNERFETYDAEQSLLFIAYHELGHALVDLYNLEVRGNEEIAVDGFATWWAVQGGVGEAAVHGAMTFDQFGMMEDRSPYYIDNEVHGRSGARYLNIACWLEGAGHAVPEHFLRELGPNQGSVCREAYDSLVQQWTQVVRVHDPGAN